MKYFEKLLLLFFVFNLFTPLYAQLELGPAAKLVRKGKLLPRPGVPYLSHRVNADFYQRMTDQVSRAASFPTVDLKQGHAFRSTFQLQHTDSPFALTGSGFAIDLLDDGNVWGVTAGHVMRRIAHYKKHRKPHIRVTTGPDSFIIAPIKNFYIGNPESMDIALFEIPKEVLPYVTVLHPAKQAPAVGQEVTIRGFFEEHAQPFTLSHQKILSATPLRLFLQKTPVEDMRGFCGSPGFINDRVSMVYIGFDSARTMVYYDWFNKLPPKAKFPMSNLHYAIPIDVAKSMAKSIKENGTTEENAIMMKVLGHPVAVLHPNESIVSIEQLRNGEIIAKEDIYRHIAVNPEHLDLFFNLQENDVLRISLDNFSMQHPYPPVSMVYEVNVSTGQVTKIPVP
ncbi:MAG: hypothetical protein IKP06_07200 [Elusimicrobiaceae bacterium]|nr:hypothetical protein [Elusimicrobiaceae bacterium]